MLVSINEVGFLLLILTETADLVEVANNNCEHLVSPIL